ncbi:MAG: hypothetical protein ACYS1A_19470 [Planctomycetota bacterium]
MDLTFYHCPACIFVFASNYQDLIFCPYCQEKLESVDEDKGCFEWLDDKFVVVPSHISEDDKDKLETLLNKLASMTDRQRARYWRK